MKYLKQKKMNWLMLRKKLADEKTKKEAVLGEYAGGNKVIRQLIDFALLQNNMLKVKL